LFAVNPAAGSAMGGSGMNKHSSAPSLSRPGGLSGTILRVRKSSTSCSAAQLVASRLFRYYISMERKGHSL